MKRPRIIGTPEIREQARKMREEGLTWYAIGMWFGTRGEYVRRWLDPEFRNAFDAKQRRRKIRARAHKGNYRTKRTPALEAAARFLRARGLSWYKIEKRLGLSKYTARTWLDPEFHEHRKKIDREYRRDQRRCSSALEAAE